MTRRGWFWALGAVLGLALVSLASNITTDSQLAGEANMWLAIRFTISKVANAGTLWAGLAVAVGWFLRGRMPAVVGGILAGVLVLAVHYGLGVLSGMFDSSIWAHNWHWFVAAVITGGPLGLVGAIARQGGMWGVLARLLVPAAAVVEPFARGLFTTPAFLPWPGRVSDTVSGMILLAGGVAGVMVIVVTARKSNQPANEKRPQSGTDAPPRDT